MTKDQPIYQLYLWIKDISPLIWRRLLVHNDTTIADLHHIIQISLEWTDEYLHQFIIHGKAYGIYHDGGMSFSDNPRTVRLNNFQFRAKERFFYEYNFFAHWEIEIRLEKFLPPQPRQNYPFCSAGNGVAPPEDCGGVKRFMALNDYYSINHLYSNLCELVEAYEDKNIDIDDFSKRLDILQYWASRGKFARHNVNKALQQYVADQSQRNPSYAD